MQRQNGLVVGDAVPRLGPGRCRVARLASYFAGVALKSVTVCHSPLALWLPNTRRQVLASGSQVKRTPGRGAVSAIVEAALFTPDGAMS
jgi:hypothetical protein